MNITPIQATPKAVPLTLNVRHLLIDAENIAKKHKSFTVEIKHLLVTLVNQVHGFGGAFLKDLLREQKRSLDLWTKLQEIDPPIHPLYQAPVQLTLSEQLEWVLEEANYIAKEHETRSVGSAEVLLAVARLLKKSDRNEFPDKVENSVHFQDKVNHVAKKFIFHGNAVHVKEFDIVQKLLGLEPKELEDKINKELTSHFGRLRFY